EVAFGGGAQAYGARVRSVGGPANLAYNVTAVNVGDSETREGRTAYLNSLSLANGQASASAIAADADGATKSTADPGYIASHCTDFGHAPITDEQNGSAARCEADKALV